jgi:hypothetical protein
MTVKTEITYDNTAAVFEAWLISADGEREWVGAFDTRQEARDALERITA